jgi:hypothetical protein
LAPSVERDRSGGAQFPGGATQGSKFLVRACQAAREIGAMAQHPTIVAEEPEPTPARKATKWRARGQIAYVKTAS